MRGTCPKGTPDVKDANKGTMITTAYVKRTKVKQSSNQLAATTECPEHNLPSTQKA